MKKVLTGVLASLLAMVGAEVSSPATTSVFATTSSEQPITLQFWTVSLKPTFTGFIQGLINTYEQQHPNIKIDWQDLPQDAIQSKLITSTAGGNAPDVVNMWSQLTVTLAGKGALVDLNQAATPQQKGIYIPSLFAAGKLGNGVYAFPWYATPNIQMYNKALYQKAGIMTPPKTYNQLFTLAKKMHDATGAYMFVPDDLPHIFLLNNIPLLTANKKAAAFNTPQALALLNKFRQGVTAGYIPKTGWNNWDNDIQLFSTGKLASINSGPQTVKQIKDQAPNIYKVMGIAPAVVGSTGLTQTDVENLSIPTGSKHVKEAVDFANYITDDANELAFCKLVSIFPTTKKAAANSYFTSNMKTLDGQANAEAAKSSTHMTDAVLGIQNETQVEDIIGNIAQAVFMTNTDPKTALNDAEKKVNQLLAQNH